MIAAVLTGDIVDSTRLNSSQEKRLFTELETLLSPFPFEFYRGDSFQAYVDNGSQALELALLCRTTALALIQEETDFLPDVRISIGLGSVETPVKTPGSAKGEAFLLSGRALDELEKTQGRLVITIDHKLGNLGFMVMADYINSIYKQMTAKQAEVIKELIRGDTQQQVADKLNRSKSTISQHVTAGRWDEIEKILANYKKMIESLT